MTPPYSPALDMSLSNHMETEVHTAERQQQHQNQGVQQSRSMDNDRYAVRTSTPLMKYNETILPGLVEMRQEARPSAEMSPNSAKSTFFQAFRDRLIQQQWQSDREQQWRIDHEPQGLGTLARLPPEIRRQIYRACFPPEYVDVDVKTSEHLRPRGGLVSLMRSTRCIYGEVKPTIEEHAQSRLFNLVLSNKGVRFEGKQLAIDFLTQDGLQNMTSETISPLGVFSRTKNRIRNLRLVIQIDSRATPPGLVLALEPFTMWVFSLLSRAKALQILLVEFHLSHIFPAETLAYDDGSEMSIERLIGILLGARAAAHCKTVMKEALTSELQVVRFVIRQKASTDHQQERMITSFRWSRPPSFQPHVPQPVEKQPEISPMRGKAPSPIPQTESERDSAECSPARPQVGESQPPEVLSQSAESLEPPKSEALSPRPATVDSDSSAQAHSSQTFLKRHRKHDTVLQAHKRRRTDLGDRASSSTTESQAGSSRQISDTADQKSRSASVEMAVDEDEYVVQSLRDVRIKNGVSQIKVKWNGYDQMTWEPRATLMEDVPDMVRDFDKRHWKPPSSAIPSDTKAKVEHHTSTPTLQDKVEVEGLNQHPQEPIETPRTAANRLNQWKAQQQGQPSAAATSPDRTRTFKYVSRAPKRPLTAYFLYMQANRPSIWDDLCKKLGSPDLVKEKNIANEGTRRWLALETEQREAWERMHAKRVAIYHVQVEAYKAGKPVPSQEEARSLLESSGVQASVVDLT